MAKSVDLQREEPGARAQMDGGLAPLTPRRAIEDDVYDALLSELIALRIPPGERMSLDALSRQLGVSQTPVRAALIRLEAEGLVVKKFNSGYSAAPMPSGARFSDVYAMRLLIEPEAAYLATHNLDAAGRVRLLGLGADMARQLDGDTRANYGRFASLDGQFHLTIAQFCGNKVILETLKRLYAHMNIFRLRYHTSVASDAVTEHVAILEAMQNGDAEGARQAMMAHISSSRTRMEPFYSA